MGAVLDHDDLHTYLSPLRLQTRAPRTRRPKRQRRGDGVRSRMADQETANAGLEKVTDYVDEQELNADDTADALKNLAANPGARYRDALVTHIVCYADIGWMW